MPTARVEWVDAAKGIAILLVVLFHSTTFLHEVGLASSWVLANPVLETFRMPLFFFAAGMFAGKSLRLSLPRMLRRRAWPLLWLYLLWTVVYVLLLQVLPWEWTGQPRVPLTSIVTSVTSPNASLWFLYALALYSVAAWLIRRLPVWAQLVPAAVLSVIVSSRLVPLGDDAWSKPLIYFVFFLVAVHFASLAERLRPGWWAWPVLVAYFAASAGAIALGVYFVPGVRLVLSLGAIAAGVLLAKVLDGTRGFGWLRWLGQRTLPVYVLHYYPIFLVAALLAPIADRLAPAAVLLPPMLVAVAVAVVLTVHRVTERLPLLWTAPGRARPAPARQRVATGSAEATAG